MVAVRCASCFWPSGGVIECGLLSGLSLRRQQAAGRDGDQRIGSKSAIRALWRMVAKWFVQSRSVRSFFPFRSSTSYTPLHSGFDGGVMQPTLPDPDNPHFSSASPKSAAPSCLRELPRRAFSASEPSFWPAMNSSRWFVDPANSCATWHL